MHLTAGTLAMINLQAQIESLERRIEAGWTGVADKTTLIELIALRGQVRSRISDYEWAEAAAEKLARDAPADPAAFVARARVRIGFHRFSEALSDLDTAHDLGADRADIDVERASIFQAVGRYDDAIAIYDKVATRRAEFDSLGALATLHADCGEIEIAEQLFDESRACYRNVSPFPPALLDFQRGHMWLEEGDLHQARIWFESALRSLPAYAAADGHLAEIEAALGAPEGAVARLLTLATSSDDPDYSASLARILKEAGHEEEAREWRSAAAARYDELMTRHPEAFADHAAEFWLEADGDRDRALRLATMNLELRKTRRALHLFARACAK